MATCIRRPTALKLTGGYGMGSRWQSGRIEIVMVFGAYLLTVRRDRISSVRDNDGSRQLADDVFGGCDDIQG